MTTVDRTEFRREKSYATLSRGEALRMTRELKGLTQAELAARSGVPQAAISSIENERIDVGLDRVEKLARALGVHPAVLAFPNWRGTAPRTAARPVPNIASRAQRRRLRHGPRRAAKRRALSRSTG